MKTNWKYTQDVICINPLDETIKYRWYNIKRYRNI